MINNEINEIGERITEKARKEEKSIEVNEI